MILNAQIEKIVYLGKNGNIERIEDLAELAVEVEAINTL
jgi:hypothetical protein